MFFYVIATTIASYTHGWTRLRNVGEAWAASRDDDLYHTPSLKAAALLSARDTTESPLDGSDTRPDAPDRTRLLIGIMSCVGLVLLITFFCLLLWSRHSLHAERERSEHDGDTEGGNPISQEAKGRTSGLRPLRLWSPPASWGVQRKSMALPIHAPPKVQRESMILPIHSPPNSLLHPVSQFLLQPMPHDSPRIPTTPPRAARAHIRPYTQHTRRAHKDCKTIGTTIIGSPAQTQLGPRSPPPTYAQATFHSLVETAPAKELCPSSYLSSTIKTPNDY